MDITRCPKCKNLTNVDISKAIDEEGEVFICYHCGWKFRYAPNG